MTIRFFIFCLFFLFSAFTSFGCDKKDGVVVISQHLRKDSSAFEAVRRSEALARRKDWKAAALAAKEGVEKGIGEELSCCEEAGLILKYAYLTYLFNARNDDPDIPLKTKEALAQYEARCKEEFSRVYAELYVLLMAYYWSLNDKVSHDEILKKLVLYDKDSVYYFVTLLYACLERPRCAKNMKAFLEDYKGKKGAHYEIAVVFYGCSSEEDKKALVLNWLKNNADVDLFVLRCFAAHAASMFDHTDMDFIVSYDRALLNWLKSQEDKEERKEAFVFVLSEHYRLAAILPNCFK